MTGDCWIAQQDGSGVIWFREELQPNPVPVPAYAIRKSDHKMIPGSSDPGLTVLQRLGWDAGRLKVVLPLVWPATLEQLRTLYFRFQSGQQLGVRFFDSVTTWQCVWDSDWSPQRAVRGRERYRLEFELLIEGEVS